MKIQKNIDLSKLTTIKTGGKAKFFVKAKNNVQLISSLKHANQNSLNVFILGGGSNVLISDKGFDGIVIKNDIKGIQILKKTKNNVVIKVGAGENWDKFVKYCISNNFQGIECLSGIPGLVGASPIQNIGAYGQEVKDTITNVEAINKKTLQFENFTNKECKFEYRSSYFKIAKNHIVTNVTFTLNITKTSELTYKALEEQFANKTPTLEQVRKKVLTIRRSKGMVYSETDTDSHSTGSFFVNPVVNKNKAQELLKKYPTMPNFPTIEEYKIPAAWLIENAGFSKGYQYKSAALSNKHVLAMSNKGNAKSQHFYELAKLIKSHVRKEFGILLFEETQIIGEF